MGIGGEPRELVPQLGHGRTRLVAGAQVERARRAGLDTIVVDLSRADVDLAVAKVVVPGLRHFWPRFGPGRLYDVPVAMGWRDRPLTESELNPVHLFL